MGCNATAEQTQYISRTIAFVGLDGSGKSSIVHQMINPNATEEFIPIPTAGADYYESSMGASKFCIYDCGGIGRYRDEWNFYIKHSDAVCFVIDRTDKKRMSVVRDEIGMILQKCQLQQIPILILINKTDKKSSLTISDFELITKVNEFKVDGDIKECSAENGEGIVAARDWLLQHIKPRTTTITTTTEEK
ncbi:hypothetical protein M9Y10_009901 [Tritrichomonas musculus]|uniref:Uncharacterized protein n=1 Tax=Tritrichomonas musculus TaxID=1915356 RepID=A0ABR2IPV6_9EUKA